MFRLITNRAVAQQTLVALRVAFGRGATKAVETLSTPGGQIPNAPLFVRRDLDLWAYFQGRPDRRGLLLGWFGVGQPSWHPSIEINIPVRRTLYCYGQLVMDEQEDVCLAHRGGLGGGKFTVAPGPFGDLINGFEREPVHDGSYERQYFVIGRVSQPSQLLERLSRFVHEAERIRELRRNERKFRSALEALGGAIQNKKAIGGSDEEYTGETVGAGDYLLHRQVQYERVHARVQRALAKQLQKRGLKCGNRRQKHGLAPDLYVRDRRGRMAHLFEIKVGRDSQSTFTALGQLLVYSAGEMTCSP